VLDELHPEGLVLGGVVGAAVVTGTQSAKTTWNSLLTATSRLLWKSTAIARDDKLPSELQGGRVVGAIVVGHIVVP
jgi:hypothetical protein